MLRYNQKVQYIPQFIIISKTLFKGAFPFVQSARITLYLPDDCGLRTVNNHD